MDCAISDALSILSAELQLARIKANAADAKSLRVISIPNVKIDMRNLIIL